MREFQLLSRLQHHRVRLLAVTPHYGRDKREWLSAMECLDGATFFPAQPHLAPPRFSTKKRATFSRELCAAWNGILNDFQPDLIHSEGYFMAPSLKDCRGIPSLVVAENVEFMLSRMKQYIELEPTDWETVFEEEMKVWQEATLCAALSLEDREVIASHIGSHSVWLSPNGADHLRGTFRNPPRKRAKKHTANLVFVGNCSWEPTRSAALRLVAQIWPEILHQYPGKAILHLAGRGMTKVGLGLDSGVDCKGVQFHGVVSELVELLESSDVFIAPLEFGGGVKMKILEAISSGLPIVTTSIGAQGLPDNVCESLDIAESNSEIIAMTLRLLTDASYRRVRGSRLKRVSGQLGTWSDAAKCLEDIWTNATYSKALFSGSL